MPNASVRVRIKSENEKATGMVAARLCGMYLGTWGGRVLPGNDGDYIAWVDLLVKVDE